MNISSSPGWVKPALLFAAALSKAVLLAALISVIVLPLAPRPAAANSGPSDAEAHALDLINQERAKMGRAALQWDARLSDIAQWRSNVQASRDQMFHDLGAVTNKMEKKNIRWFESVGEALLQGTPRSAWSSAEEAVTWWKGSDAHWDMLMSTQARYNYIALGMAKANSGWWYWTAVVFVGPDRTAPKANVSDANARRLSGGGSSVTVSWTGHDVELFSYTSGLRDFRLQQRVGNGSWVTVSDWTTATSKSFDVNAGRTYSYRVRARDERGNKSGWSAPVSVTP